MGTRLVCCRQAEPAARRPGTQAVPAPCFVIAACASLRAMRLLDRYLLRELSVPLGYCLGGFLIFWISFDLISELENFQRNRLKGIEVAVYYALRLPEFLV